MPTSRARRWVSPSFMPLSIASCTRSSPTTGPEAPSIAITASTPTRPQCPRRYRPRRLRPVLRCCKDLVSEEPLEDAVAAQQLRGRSRLLDDAVDENDRAVCDLHRGEALRGDEHGPSRDGRPQRVDQQPLCLRVDRG